MAFQIIRNDITRVHADAIVNTANPEPVCAGGTDYAIYEAAGMEQLLRARKEIGRIERGKAVQTPAFRLHAKFIIHTVGPVWQGGDHGEFDILKACYENSLQLALKLQCRSIAFPLIATGVYGFPKDRALQIALSVIQPFVMEHDMKIILVVFDKRAFELSGSVVEHVREYVGANYVTEAHRKEYAVDRFRNLRSRNRSIQSENFLETADLSFARRMPERAEPVGSIVPEKMSEPDDRCLMSAQEEHCAQFTKDNTQSDRRIESCLYLSDEEYEPEYTEECASECLPADLSAGYKGPAVPLQSSLHYNTEWPGVSVPHAKQATLAKTADTSGRVDISAMLAATEKTFQEKLFEIIDARGLTGPQVYKNYISKQVYSKIQADKNYHPNKFTAIALCLSLHLNIAETQDLIGRAGWALSPSNKADVVVTGCIMNREYNLVQINIILFEFDCPELEKIK